MKFKKSIALIISVIMIFASLTSLVTAATVSDIGGHWSQQYVQSLVDQDIIKGYEDGTFKPDNSITRGEFCTIITKALDKAGIIDGIVAPEGKFTDVAKGSWYAPFIETAAKYEFVSGVGNNMFDPEANITRQEMAKIVSLVYCKINNIKLEDLKADSKASDFSDYSKADSWAKEYIDAAFNAKLMKGNEDGSFNPIGQVTRAETATVTYRLLDGVKPTGTAAVSTEDPSATATPVVTDPPAPIRSHGEEVTYNSTNVSVANNPSFDFINDNGIDMRTFLTDGIMNDKTSSFTTLDPKPEYLINLGSVKQIQSFLISGYNSTKQSVLFKMYLSKDNDSWLEVGNDIVATCGQPIIDDKSIYTVDNFDTTTGHIITGAYPTKFDVTTQDEHFTKANWANRTHQDTTGAEEDVDCLAVPQMDTTIADVDWASLGFVGTYQDYAFHFFMDEVQDVQYVKIIGYGNTSTQWYMWSSILEFRLFGPDAPVVE